MRNMSTMCQMAMMSETQRLVMAMTHRGGFRKSCWLRV